MALDMLASDRSDTGSEPAAGPGLETRNPRNPDSRSAAAALLTALAHPPIMGGCPEAGRLLACVAQGYVIAAYAALKEGPLAKVSTADDRSAGGWQVRIGRADPDATASTPQDAAYKVTHHRRERLTAATDPSAAIEWCLELVFDCEVNLVAATVRIDGLAGELAQSGISRKEATRLTGATLVGSRWRQPRRKPAARKIRQGRGREREGTPC